MARATSAPPKKGWQAIFLATLAECPDISQAAATAGVQRSTAYRARQADEDFALAWADAHAKSLDELEAALFIRAKQTDTTAAIFLLKSHRRETYGDQVKVNHSGSVKHDVQQMTDKELRDLASDLEEARRS